MEEYASNKYKDYFMKGVNMKSSTIKSIACGIIMLMLLSIIQLPILANTNEENIILKKADKEFIIYEKDLYENEFQFAFSEVSTAEEEELDFINSAKDSLDADALNIAYVDEDLYNKFFTDGNAYLWVKDDSGLVVKAELINLEDAIDNNQVNTVNNTTKRIEVSTAVSDPTTQTVDGVDITVSVGKMVIKPTEGSKYYYQLVRLEGASEEYATLFTLAEQLKNGVKGTYNQLETTKEFYELYNELASNLADKDWNAVDNYEVLQPENTKQGEKYIVWLQEVNGTDEVVDVQFLTSTYDYEEVKEPEKIVIQEVVKLPVTYDSIALFVILGILVIAVVIVAIVKVKSNKKSENK